MHLKATYMSSLRPLALVASGTHTHTHIRTFIPETKQKDKNWCSPSFFCEGFFFEGSQRIWLVPSVVIFFLTCFFCGGVGLSAVLARVTCGRSAEGVGRQAKVSAPEEATATAAAQQQQQQNSSSSSSACPRARSDAGACGEGDAS